MRQIKVGQLPALLAQPLQHDEHLVGELVVRQAQVHDVLQPQPGAEDHVQSADSELCVGEYQRVGLLLEHLNELEGVGTDLLGGDAVPVLEGAGELYLVDEGVEGLDLLGAARLEQLGVDQHHRLLVVDDFGDNAHPLPVDGHLGLLAVGLVAHPGLGALEGPAKPEAVFEVWEL